MPARGEGEGVEEDEGDEGRQCTFTWFASEASRAGDGCARAAALGLAGLGRSGEAAMTVGRGGGRELGRGRGRGGAPALGGAAAELGGDRQKSGGIEGSGVCTDASRGREGADRYGNKYLQMTTQSPIGGGKHKR